MRKGLIVEKCFVHFYSAKQVCDFLVVKLSDMRSIIVVLYRSVPCVTDTLFENLSIVLGAYR